MLQVSLPSGQTDICLLPDLDGIAYFLNEKLSIRNSSLTGVSRMKGMDNSFQCCIKDGIRPPLPARAHCHKVHLNCYRIHRQVLDKHNMVKWIYPSSEYFGVV